MDESLHNEADTPPGPAGPTTVGPASVGSSPVDRYVAASRQHAERGEVRLAALAMWAADIEVLQELLWESGLGEAPDPDAQLAAVGEAVLGSMEPSLEQTGSATARQLVEQSRQAMVATFDESVHAMLEERFRPLDHLDTAPTPAESPDEPSPAESSDEPAAGQPAPGDAAPGEPAPGEPAPGRAVSAGNGAGAAALRLEARTPDMLVAELEVTAADCMSVAEVMLLDDERAGALRQAWQADLACFEAFLVTAAVRAGDHDLASVDLRWGLAATLDLPDSAAAADFEQVVAAWRERLVGVVSGGEAAALRAAFLPVPAP